MVQVPSGIISALAHPPYGVISRETGLTLTHGLWHCQRIRGPVKVDAFGMSFSFVTIPAAFGSTPALHVDYEEPIVWFAPVYTLFDGHDVYGPTTEITHEGDLYFLDQLFPTKVDVFVQVGCTVTQFWLVAL